MSVKHEIRIQKFICFVILLICITDGFNNNITVCLPLGSMVLSLIHQKISRGMAIVRKKKTHASLIMHCVTVKKSGSLAVYSATILLLFMLASFPVSTANFFLDVEKNCRFFSNMQKKKKLVVVTGYEANSMHMLGSTHHFFKTWKQ